MDAFLTANHHGLLRGHNRYHSADEDSEAEGIMSSDSDEHEFEVINNEERFPSSTPRADSTMEAGDDFGKLEMDVDQMSNYTMTSMIPGKNDRSDGLNLYDHFTMKFMINEESDVMCTRFHGRRLFVALANGSIRVYICRRGGVTCQYILADDDTFKNSVTSMVFLEKSPSAGIAVTAEGGFYKDLSDSDRDPVLIVSYVSGLVKFWHVTSKQCLSTIREHGSESLTCAISNDKKCLYTAGDHDISKNIPFAIKQYDIETKKLIGTFSPSVKTSTANSFIDGHVRRIFALKMNPEYNHSFISAGWDDTVQFWDDREQHSVRRISGPHVCSESSLDISPDGKEILAGSWRRWDNLQRFEWSSAKCIKNYEMAPRHPPIQPYSVKYLDARTIGVGTSSENTFMTFDTLINNGRHDIPMTKIANLPGGVYSFDSLVQDKAGLMRDDGVSEYSMSMRSTTTGTNANSNLYRLYAIASSTNVYLALQNKPLSTLV